tara:strand:- start:8615 stop:8818 length:204 start_codon:yes stop_codon:yes gene_type:complete
MKTKTNNNEFICPCGGGQSCIIDRRKNKDWVHEDDVFKNNKLPLRKHCFQQYYNSQKTALKKFFIPN